MLRVEASNSFSPRAARSRRLHALGPGARAAAGPKHGVLPALSAPPPRALPRVPQAPSLVRSDRWSVRVELGEDEVARLYGQGLARGAVVWKRGMVEWRPLLITPELTNLLRQTRITPGEAPAPDESAEPAAPTPPPAPPAPLTGHNLPPHEAERRVPTTVAPTALDVVPFAPASKPRYDLIGAAALSFGLAWFGQAALSSEPEVTLPAPVSAQVAPQPVAVPLPASPPPASTIPQVSLADLPTLASRGASRGSAYRTVTTRASTPSAGSSSSNEGASRSALVGALSQVASVAAGCGERGGAVRVVITFANSGVARSIKVSGQDLPASTRSCIIGAASRARIPSFSGDPVTVSKTL